MHQRARDRHALLHAARELGRPLVHGVGQAHRGQQLARALLALRGADAAFAHQRRQRHVLQRGEGRQQVVELEHEAQRAAPAQRQAGVVQRPAPPRPASGSCPAVMRSSRPMMLSSVLLPEPEGPISATNSPRADAQVHAVQHLGLVGQAEVVALADAVELDQRRRRRVHGVTSGSPAPGPARRRGAPAPPRPARRRRWRCRATCSASGQRQRDRRTAAGRRSRARSA